MKQWLGFIAFFCCLSLVISDVVPAAPKSPHECACACVSGCADVCCCAEKGVRFESPLGCAPADQKVHLGSTAGKELPFSAQSVEVAFYWELFSLSETLKPDSPFYTVKVPPPQRFS